MKTAMQELILWIEKRRTNHVVIPTTSLDIYGKAHDLLSTEMQQIKDAYKVGVQDAIGIYHDERDPQEFYNTTYNL